MSHNNYNYSASQSTGWEIAVIGMAARFPGARDIHQFWENLKNGVETISFFTPKQLEKAGVPLQQQQDPNYVNAFGSLEDSDYFDAHFFDYTPNDARLLDPQTRLFHECAWQALEDGGYDPFVYKGLIGLYAGASPHFDWEARVVMSGKGTDIGQFAAAQLMDKEFMNAHVSYKFNLTGPSFSIYTACSTSLVAIHLAGQAILNGECDMALAGGVTITRAGKASGYLYQEGMVLSLDGHCRAFDAAAKGMVGGNGVGVVLLKRLQDALKDGDFIYALIKGSTVNNDGERKLGFTAPSVKGQLEVIRTTLQMAETEPCSIGYVEAHGTATPLGDPVEIEALKLAFNTDKKEFCPIGSVKTNIGHLDAAAGAAGFIKAVLMLKHRLIPPSLHFESPNPNIDFKNSPFYVNTKLTPWKNSQYPLRAGVSSFGIGGTNAHVVLEEWSEDRRQGTDEREYQLILLSAKTESALDKMTGNLAQYLKNNFPNPGNHHPGHPVNPMNHGSDFANAAYTLQVGRRTFQYRRMLVCSDINEAVQQLAAAKDPDTAKRRNLYQAKVIEGRKTTVFMFPGLGTQYIDMGRELYDNEPLFRQETDRCFEILNALGRDGIKQILYPPLVHHRSDRSGNSNETSINQTDVAQMVVFIFEYALARLLMAWGIQPDAMVGYSFGEYAAACIAGVFSLEDAIKLLVARGQLIRRVGQGVMISVPLPREQIIPWLDSSLAIAVDNGASCIVSGNREAADAFENRVKEKRLLCMRLPTNHALHSPMMTPIMDELTRIASTVTFNKPRIPYISNVSGLHITDRQALDPSYWADHMRQTVRFADALRLLTEKENTIFLEIGPGNDLTALVQRHIHNDKNQQVLDLIPSRQRNTACFPFLLNRIGHLWLRGQKIRWTALHRQREPQRIPLPSYPFEREQFRFEKDPFTDSVPLVGETGKPGTSTLHKKKDVSDWFYIPSWKRSMLPTETGRKEQQKNNWLIFLDQPGLGSLIVQQLNQGKQSGDQVVTVKQSSSYKQLNDKEYLVDPRKSSDYEKLFKELKHKNRFPTRILHLWSLSKHAQTESAVDKQRIREDLYQGFYSLIYLAQTITKQQFNEEIQTWVVTNQTQAVTGDEQICPGKATILGPARVIPQEYPFLVCRTIDVVLPPGSGQEKKLVAQLKKEITAETNEPVIAYRNNNRWLQTFEPVRLEEVTGDIPLLKKEGVYLITGGFGNIGFTLAKHLAERVKARLVLTGRTTLPPPTQWQRLLTQQDTKDPVTRRIKKIRELEETGAEVLAFGVDVADLQQMQQVVSQAEERFGQIHGLIHAAGVTGPDLLSSTLDQLDETLCSQQFHAKIYGLLVLEKIFRQKDIDFCLLTSSLSPLLGGLGFTAYAAANCFMDAFVHRCSRHGSGRWISINWGDWRFSEINIQGAGLGAAAAALTMSPTEGVKTFQRILYHCDTPQLAVSAGDLKARYEKWINLETLHQDTIHNKKNQTPSSSLSLTKPGLTTPYTAPVNDTEKTLVNIWQDLFGYRQIGVQDHFFELGGDSLKAIALVAKIHKELHVKLPLAEIFNNPFIQQQALYIDNTAKDQYASPEPAEKMEYYALSSAQKRLYFLHQLDPQSTAYNEPYSLHLGEEIDKDKLEATLKKLINRHESLKSSFITVNGEPVQRVHHQVEFEITYHDLTARTGSGTGNKNSRQMSALDRDKIVKSFIRPFDLSQTPLVRLIVIKVAEADYLFLFDMHHIITDGTSHVILHREFFSSYSGQELPRLRLQYKDYAIWKNNPKQQELIKDQEAYWLKMLSGELPIINLPADFQRPTVQRFEGAWLSFGIDERETSGLKTIAKENEATFYMVALAVFNVFLSKLAHQEDIIVGTPTAGRRHADLEPIIGVFVNTLSIRNRPVDDKPFVTFLEEIKQNTLQAYENQDYPFEKIVDRVSVQRDTGRNPIFDIMFNLQNQAEYEGEVPKPGEIVYRPQMISKFDMNLICYEMGNNLLFTFEYRTKLFKTETIERFSGYLKQIISSLVKEPAQELFEIEMLTRKEKDQLLHNFNHTRTPYPKDKTITQLFAFQVENGPEKVAVVFKDQQVTYKELNRQANQLGTALIEKGVTTNSIVAIMVPNSVGMIAGILGILNAGAAYLPIDPEYPEERIKYMLKDSGAGVLLTTPGLSEKFKKLSIVNEMGPNRRRLNNTPKEANSINNYQFTINNLQLEQANLAYIIYTSGTTGKPKGVLIQHKNVVRLLFNDTFQFDFNNSDVWTMFHSYCFDFSVWEMYGALLYGGKLLVFPRMTARDPGIYYQLLKTRQVTVLNQTPSAFYNLAEKVLTHPGDQLALRYVIFGGEALNPLRLKKWQAHYPQTKLINMFGITETTVHVTYKEITHREIEFNTSNIGKPIPTLSVYVVDGNLQLMAPGVPGELLVGGEGVSRGYLNQPALTAEKFVANPYKLGEPCYRSGDRVRLLVDGDLEYLGRIDQQIQVRGYRVEPGEIENRLLSHKEIKNATVIARGNQEGNQELCAYIVAGNAGTFKLDKRELREFLAGMLPDYMIPSYFTVMEKIPLTANGKLDRAALPEPGSGLTDETYVPPSSRIEEKLVQVWQEVLAVEGIGITDHFFEIGGDSIKAIQVAARLKKYQLELKIIDLFSHPIIKELAGCIKKTERTIFQGTVEGEVPLTPIQQRFFEKDPNARHHFNQAVMLYSKETFDRDALIVVFKKILEHHDALRMTYSLENNRVRQINQGLNHPFSLEVFDLQDCKNAIKKLEEKANEIQSGIDLQTGPLIKLGLFHMEDGDRLSIVIHHLVIDGVSWRILFEDIDRLYCQYKQGNKLELPPKSDSFKTWAEKLHQYADSELFLKEKSYWTQLETMVLPGIKRDYEVKHNYVKDAAHLSFQLAEAETKNLLTKVNEPFGTEINDILLTALGLGLKKTYGQKRFSIALEGHGREEILEDIDISRTVGWFTSIYPVVLEIAYEDNLSRQIKEVKESLRRVPHKGIGFGILKYLTSRKNKDEREFHLKPRVSFNYLGQFDADIEQRSFTTANESPGNNIDPGMSAEYEFDFSSIILDKQLHMSMTYNKKQYKPETVQRLLSHFKTALLKIIDYCSQRQERELTPADLTCKELTIDELDKIYSIYDKERQGNIQDIYPLSPMQEGMFFHALADPSSPAYFEQMSYRLQGELDISRLEMTANELLERHDVLRTAFEPAIAGQPIQIVFKKRKVEFYYQDFHDKHPSAGERQKNASIENFKKKDKQRGFDLSKDVLLRVSVLRLDSSEYEFTWSFHHILMDGWCIGILVTEFFHIYQAHIKGKILRLPRVEPYKTYIQWLQAQDKETSRRYWKDYLEHFEEATGMPKQKRSEREYKLEQMTFPLEKETAASLKHLAARNKVTLNTLIQTVWGILLGRYNDKEDVVFGAVVSGRPPGIEGVESMIGLFINTVPVRIGWDKTATFTGLLKKVQQEAINSEPHYYYPLARVQSESLLKRNLLDHILIFENYPVAEQIDGVAWEDEADEQKEKNHEHHLTLSKVEVFEQTNYDFNIMVIPREPLIIKLDYNENVYESDFVANIIHHLSELFRQILENETVSIDSLTILTQKEKYRLLYEWNNTQAPYPAGKTIHQLFAEQVQRTPDNIAAAGNHQKHEKVGLEGTGGLAPLFTHITYKELNKTSDQLAHSLKEKGIRPNTIAGIMIERSIEMITGIFGILKAGGAYMPLDPDYPEERIKYMLKDSGAQVLLTDSANKITYEKNIVRIPDAINWHFVPTITGSGTHLSPSPATSLAYIIYTSGTTGKPKGVLMEHRSLVNRLNWMQKKYPLERSDTILQKTPYTFDVSVWEILWWAMVGAKVNLLVPGGEKDPEAIIGSVEKGNVTIIHFVPSMLSAFLDYLPGNIDMKRLSRLRQVIASGEALTSVHVQRFNQIFSGEHTARLANLYGPTEAAIDVSYYDCPKTGEMETIPIGKPIDNIQLYILSGIGRHLQPAGIAGELCIAGVGLARGYLNNPELTCEKFNHDLWDYQDDHDELRKTNKKFLQGSRGQFLQKAPPSRRRQKLYKTGDLARWLSNGNIQFLGRFDQQVKIRGFRVELGEIENRLSRHNQIEAAVVLTKEGKNQDKYLCAYIVSSKEVSITQLKEYLADYLPGYMIPAYILKLERFPLTANGKIDRKALPEPGTGLTDDSYVPPTSRVEKQLLEVWQEVLGVKGIGITDNFLEIGGDSIKALQVATRLKKVNLDVKINDLFSHPTIKNLAGCVKKTKRTIFQGMVAGEVKLTPIQQWFFQLDTVDLHHFNQAVMLCAKERFDPGSLKAVFATLQQHHDALRLTFPAGNDRVRQINRGRDIPVSLQVFDLRSSENTLKKLEDKANEIQASINLQTGPLMKLGLFHLEDGDRLLIVSHHLVIDGVSWRILFEDIDTLYHQYQEGKKLELPLKTDSFKTWAEKLDQYANSDSFLKEKPYWTQLASQACPAIEKDFAVKDNYIKDTAVLSFLLSETETRHLLTKANEPFATEMNDILLTALGLAIKKTYGHERIAIALEGHGREEVTADIDISRTVGWFTSLYPVILQIAYENNMARHIKEVKESLRRVPNKGIGWGILTYLTSKQHKTGIRFDLKPQLRFNYLGQFDADVERKTFKMAKESPGHSVSPHRQREYEFDFSGLILDKQLRISVAYSKKQYKSETVERLVNHFKTSLLHIIDYCMQRQERELTPADLTAKGLTIDDLDRIYANYDKEKRGNIQDIYPLAPMQAGMFFHSLADPASTAYFEQISYRLEGELNIGYLKTSINELCKRHDILRTAFDHSILDRPLQIVLKERKVDFYYRDLHPLANEQKKSLWVEKFKQNDKKHTFNLSEDVLMRVAVLRLDTREYEFTWSFHHILMDGWCIGILLAEFFEIYRRLLEGKTCRLPGAEPYKTYIQWLEKQDKEVSRHYWQHYLEDFDEATVIPRFKNPKICNGPTGDKQEQMTLQLEKETTAGLKNLAARNKVTLNILVQTVWGILLGKYNGKEDTVFGAVVSGRPHDIEGVESMIGLFINTVPVRIGWNPTTAFYRLLKQVQEKAIGSEPYHYYPLAEIQAESVLKQNLLDHILIFENYPVAEHIDGVVRQDEENEVNHENPGLNWLSSHVEVFEQTPYDFNLVVIPGQELTLRFEYNGNLYNNDFMGRIPGHIKEIFHQVFIHEGISIKELTLLSFEERKEILYRFNDTRTGYPKEKSLVDLFEDQVTAVPTKTVLHELNSEITGFHVDTHKKNKPHPGEKQAGLKIPQGITYEELGQAAVKLAFLLKERGLQPGSLAGLMVSPSIGMVIGLLGILKAGGAYLPLDPEYPPERIRYVLADSSASILLTWGHLASQCHTWGLRSEIIDLSAGLPCSENPAKTLPAVTPADPAYVIYTSGSTGNPKGVMVEHRNVVRLVKHSNYIDFKDNDRLLLTGALTFDITTFEIWGPLLNAAALYLADKNIIMDFQRLEEIVLNNNISILHFIPQLFNQLILHYPGIFAHIRFLLVGGDVVNPQFVNRLRKQYNHIKIVQMYGPTENTTFSTFFPIHDYYEEKIPIGKPVGNSKVFVLDKYGKLLPVGVTGEICTGGDGVARGYLNNPELTAEKFCLRRPEALFEKTAPIRETSAKNFLLNGTDKDYMQPYNHATMQLSPHHSFHYPITPSPHHPIYHTGDLGRWHPDGTIEFLGRIDNQVKIRGYRIELQEIENRLLKHEEIKEAVVISRLNENGNHDLCAYIVGAAATRPVRAELREYLSARLPDYVIPSYFTVIDKIPLTANGKLDRTALPDAKTGWTGDAYVPPASRIEEKLTEIWAEVLQVDQKRISVEANFFELGGHSLRATILVSKIHKALKVKVPLITVLKTSTIRGLGEYIANVPGEKLPRIVPVEKKEYYPLSTGHQRLYFIQQADLNSNRYNMPLFFPLGKDIQVTQLELALKKLVARHESLRTAFKTVNGEPVQVVEKNVDIPLLVVDVSSMDEAQKEQKIKQLQEELINRPFRLAKAPLFRWLMIKEKNEGFTFILNIHHIIFDYWSQKIIKKEIDLLYEAAGKKENNALSVLELQYKDFAAWHNRQLAHPLIKEKSHRYWQEKLKQGMPLLKLFGGNKDKTGNKNEGASYKLIVNQELTTQLRRTAGTNSTSVFMLLFSVLNMLLARFSGQKNIACSLVASGRNHPSLQNIVGFFINTLVVKTQVEYEEDFNVFLQEVNRDTLVAFEHQNYPIEQVLNHLKMRFPEITVGINMVSYVEDERSDIPGAIDTCHIDKTQVPKFYIDIEFIEYKNAIEIFCQYRKALYYPDQIQRMMQEYVKLLKQVVEDPGKKIKAYISTKKKRKVKLT